MRRSICQLWGDTPVDALKALQKYVSDRPARSASSCKRMMRA
jgi:hypothetical protein